MTLSDNDSKCVELPAYDGEIDIIRCANLDVTAALSAIEHKSADMERIGR